MGHVIVYYWAGASSIRKIGNDIISGPSFGHIALKIIPNEENPEIYEYVSFWPGCQQNNPSNDLYLCKENTSHFHTKDQDDLIYRDKLPKIVMLTNLDIDLIIEKYELFRSGNFRWGTLGSSFLSNDRTKNCVGLSLMLLNQGGFLKYIKSYYWQRLVSGGVASLPLILFISTMYSIIHVAANRFQWSFNGLFIEIASLVLWPFIGTIISSDILGSNKINFEIDKKSIALALGSILFNGIAIMDLYYAEYIGENFTINSKNPFVWLKILWWKYTNNSIGMMLFKLIASSLLGAYIGGFLFKKNEDENVFDPGFVTGLLSTSIGASAGIAITSLVSNLINLREFFTDYPLYDLNHKFPIYTIEPTYWVARTICLLSTIILSAYISSKTFNFLIYKSISTPMSLYNMSTYAHDLEQSELLSSIDLNEQKHPVNSSFINKIQENKSIVLLSAGLIVSIGFFAYRRGKMPTNIAEGVSSIASHTLSLFKVS